MMAFFRRAGNLERGWHSRCLLELASSSTSASARNQPPDKRMNGIKASVCWWDQDVWKAEGPDIIFWPLVLRVLITHTWTKGGRNSREAQENHSQGT